MTAADATKNDATKTDTAPPTDLVALTIDGRELQVPKGTLIIRAAEMIGIQIPRFCDHPLLDPVGACRQCIVEVEGQRKPVASCTTPVADGMVVTTQLTSPVAEKAQRGVMELLLINHPLDCPVCDKGGECPLQNQAMSTGRTESRFGEEKRTYPKPIPLSSEILLDRERCVLCARCTRFSGQIAGDPFIDLLERGALQQVGIYANEPSSPTSRATPSRCARSARLPVRHTDSGRDRSIWCPAPACVNTAPTDVLSARTTVAERFSAVSPGTTPKSTRNGTATRAVSHSRTRPKVIGSPLP